MITVICGTNRPDNISGRIAQVYQQKLDAHGVEAQTLTLESLPHDFVFRNEVIGEGGTEFRRIVEKFILPASKLLVVTPEYNGGIPGVFKAFIDGILPKDLYGKKAALVGVASGRAGNLRGMDQLTNIFHYLGIGVLPLKVPISQVNGLLDEEGNLSDSKTLEVIDQQIGQLLDF